MVERSAEADLVGLRALRTLDDVKLDALILVQHPEAIHLDSGVMNKYVAFGSVYRNKAEAFFRVEPLNRAGHG